MKAEIGTHRLGNFPFLHAEDGVLENLDHRAAGEPVEVTALLGRTRILGVLFRQLGEIGRSLPDLRQQARGLFPGRLDLGLGRGLVQAQQNVAGAARLGRLEARLVGLVRRLERLLAGRRLCRQCVTRKHHELGADLLRKFELLAVGVVVLLHRVGGQLHLAGIGLGVECRLIDLALFELGCQPTSCGGLSGDATFADRQRQLLHGQILAQARLEHFLAHALACNHGLVALLGELAVLLQRRHRGDELCQLLVAHRHLRRARLFGQQALGDQRIEHRAAHRRRLEKDGVELAAQLLAQAILLLAHGRLQLLLADLAAANGGDFTAAIDISDIGFDAPEGKGQRDHGKKDLGDPLVVADDVEQAHAAYTLNATKANSGSPLFLGGC